MKNLIIAILLTLISSPAIAADWCIWNGTEGEYCQDDSRGRIRMPDGHFVGGGAENYEYHGFSQLVTIQPTIGPDQTRDAEQWSFDGATITRTWTVRDLTAEEIDQREARAMSLNDYWQWKAIQQLGGWTNAQMVNVLPPELVEAFAARKRIEAQ